MKYILKLLPLALIFNAFYIFTSNPKSLNPHFVKQAIERRAGQRNALGKRQTKNAASTTKPVIHKVTKPAQPARIQPQTVPVPAAPAPIKIAAIQQTQAQVQAQAGEKMTLEQILVHLDEYVECVFACIKRFLSHEDKGKLNAFAHEIETCIKKLDNKVLKPLQAIQEPIALKLRRLVQTLRQNQCEFKNKITGGYKNAMSLGFALLTVKREAIASITKELSQCAPGIKASHVGTQFELIEKKILELTHYTVPEIQAIKVLHKRF